MSILCNCEICYVDYPSNEFVNLSCNHKYCKSCLQHTFKIKIEEKKVRKIICPGDKCEKEITFHKIKEILTKEMFKKYDSALLNDTFINDKECIFCPVPNCGNPIYGEEKYPKIICRKCDKKICYNCKTEGWHEGKCEIKQDEGVKEWMKKKGAKPCPNCSVPIEKNKGCDHVYCINCKHHFYWSNPNEEYTGTKYIPVTETEWNVLAARWNENQGPVRNLHWGRDIERGNRREQLIQAYRQNRAQMEADLEAHQARLEAHQARIEAARVQWEVEQRARAQIRFGADGGTIEEGTNYGAYRINCDHCDRIYPQNGWKTHCKTKKHRRNSEQAQQQQEREQQEREQREQQEREELQRRWDEQDNIKQ